MSTTIVRVRFSADELTSLDTLAIEVRTAIKRGLSRAGLVRALVRLRLDTPATAPELADAIDADTVRRGRARGRRS